MPPKLLQSTAVCKESYAAAQRLVDLGLVTFDERGGYHWAKGCEDDQSAKDFWNSFNKETPKYASFSE
jgi:hypothetical protein